MTVTADVIFRELTQAGFQFVEPLSDRFYCPSEEWLEEFLQWLAQRRHPYMAQKFDCDRFARWAAAMADESLFINPAINDCGHSFGEAHLFLRGEGILGIVPPMIDGVGRFGAHGTNIVRLNDGKWYLAEPQTAKYALLDSLRSGIAGFNSVRV